MNFGEKNVGLVDRVIRIVIGFLVIGYGAKYVAFPLNLIVALIGFAIVATGALGTCTLYTMLGINTAPAAAKPAAAKSRRKAKNA